VSAPTSARIDSIRQRLLNIAKQNGEEFQLTLDRYAVERLLYRLSISPYRDDFVLKGALLFRHWLDQSHRPTRDADFLGFGTPDPGRIAAVVGALCEADVDDGLVFDLSRMSVDAIRETARYDGLRVQLKARLGSATCVIQWDTGFGDAITPEPEEVRFDTMLEDVPSRGKCAFVQFAERKRTFLPSNSTVSCAQVQSLLRQANVARFASTRISGLRYDQKTKPVGP